MQDLSKTEYKMGSQAYMNVRVQLCLDTFGYILCRELELELAVGGERHNGVLSREWDIRRGLRVKDSCVSQRERKSIGE
jgi:hypothetical protein